ncbi:hypothetical protein MWU75_00700 [Ornithinimicrobium sp. F0845]|uniref:hypothetical protein n=1 Tax=Ornithinimicrobium sp. F0845 TaxID=2926412 RepID=UPI001FF680AF|nr:hypothetical protein [Ornithinimicrobium sp. F0845]MCK0110665.1 hypothetical protein [Ornithinimicrobium sp. F0845]
MVGSGDGAPPTTSVATETVTVTTTAAAPTPAQATMTVTATPATETHTVTETLEAETVTVEAEAVTETVTVGPPEPEIAFSGDGIYEVGVDIQPGTYVADAGDGCYWARLSGSDGFDSIITNHFGAGQTIATIKESDRFFETSDCGPWSRRD